MTRPATPEAVCAHCGHGKEHHFGMETPHCRLCMKQRRAYLHEFVAATPPTASAPPREEGLEEPYYRAIHDPRCAFRLAGSPHPCTCAEFADAPRSLTHEEQQAHTAIISETARPVATTGGAAETAPDPAGGTP